jgi:hypothetical protein
VARERNVPNDEAHLPRPLLEERLERGVRAPAERTLKIREEYNRGRARLDPRRSGDLVANRERRLRAACEQADDD